MKEARLKAAVLVGRTLSQAAMAELVSESLGRTLYQTQWSNYELGIAEPPLDVISATAQLSGLTAGYIAFGGKEPARGDQIQSRKVAEPPAIELHDATREAGEAGRGRKGTAKGK